ncbi:hypothetical protein HPULCUR_004958 [Helicostylum pulchrum]|uniref:LIM-domain binding protein-domain-containing protein n=1 Tax=Helicostylum pulchrum TaxID=562976 RepID=A0ABP9XXR3_9FUNG
MSTESPYNAGLHSAHEVNTNPRMQQQQQQAQLLFRQRQLQQQQQRTLPPTPTLSSQGSPAFSQLAQVIPSSVPIKPVMTTTEQRTSSMGQAVLRLLQFRDQLSPGDQAKDLMFWKSFVDDFFTTTATMKIGLLDNNTQQRIEFDITQNLIARYFYTYYQCDLDSIQLTTDQTMEYFLPNGMMLECPRSSLIHRYNNGTMVILSGELSVLFHLDPNDGVLKIHQWKFICNQHDEYIARSKLVPVDINAVSKKKLKLTSKSPTFQTPSTLVNHYGIPDRILELLRMIDVSNRVSEVAFFSLVTGLNPKDSLSAMSFNINQKMTHLYPEDQKQPQSQVHPKQKQKQEMVPPPSTEIVSSPLLTTDILSLLPNTSSPFDNTLPSTTPTPTPTPTMIQGTPQTMINSPINSQIMVNTPNTMPPGTIPNNMNPMSIQPIPSQGIPLPQQSVQFMQQQAAMQRYYQQQTLRMQHQQQALKIQQRQAMQRLQPPQMEPHVPAEARKRKSSIPKDNNSNSNSNNKKHVTKKSKKQQ